MHCTLGTDVSVASQHTFQGSSSQALEGDAELLLSDGSGAHVLQQSCHRLAKHCDERFSLNEGLNAQKGWIQLL